MTTYLYHSQGVVLIEDYFTQLELEPIKTAIAKLVDYVAERLYDEGKITSKKTAIELP
mgnify:CR=1 FL=1